MPELDRQKAWGEVFEFPLSGRDPKPRGRGLTMIIDKGLGLTETRDLLELGADYIDFIKLTFGTSAFYSAPLLKEKIALVKSYGVGIFPGGTFLEIALVQGRLRSYLNRARELGFSAIEVSDGTISMSDQLRCDAIAAVREAGFVVFTEVGKKDPGERVPHSKILEQIAADLDQGAFKVIVEGRESGKGVVIYQADGSVDHDELEGIARGVADPDAVLWEAPLKNQQVTLITRFGPNVSLGNIHPEDALALEALRVGLRGDTLRLSLQAMNMTPLAARGL